MTILGGDQHSARYFWMQDHPKDAIALLERVDAGELDRAEFAREIDKRIYAEWFKPKGR